MAESANNGGATPQKLDMAVSYRSPANASFDISTPLIAPTSSSEADTTDKYRYLRDLRGAVLAAQDEINKELTARMEEDKARDQQGSAGGVDDAKEEENYGEEVQEEEEA